MTRRERLERKLDRREEWAGKARARSEQRFSSAGALADRIPFGQPILSGHHSERHARRDAERIHNGMAAGVAEAKLADHHAAKASGLAIALERSVFSDDEDAIAKLEERIAAAEKNAERDTAINKAWRKGGAEAVRALGYGDKLVETIATTMAQCPWLKSPLSTTGTRAAIRRDRERIEEIKRRQARAASAEASGGVSVERLGSYGPDSYVRVTFAEKPSSETLDALRAAGFSWGGGSWVGLVAKLPADLAAVLPSGPEVTP